jgi:hypothetical protein
MGLMDRVKAQATQLAQKTQEAAQEGMAKFDQAQANRRGDALLRQLGVAVFAERTGRGTSDSQAKIDKLIADISAHEQANGLNLSDQPTPLLPLSGFPGAAQQGPPGGQSGGSGQAGGAAAPSAGAGSEADVAPGPAPDVAAGPAPDVAPGSAPDAGAPSDQAESLTFLGSDTPPEMVTAVNQPPFAGPSHIDTSTSFFPAPGTQDSGDQAEGAPGS